MWSKITPGNVSIYFYIYTHTHTFVIHHMLLLLRPRNVWMIKSKMAGWSTIPKCSFWELMASTLSDSVPVELR